VDFINLFEKHNKPWMNGRVRSKNLWLDRVLLRRDMSHITVTDTSSFVMEDYTMHSLHLNSRGKKRQLIAESVVGGHASGISSIRVKPMLGRLFYLKFKSTEMLNILVH
jgi:hypothetical protein